jgi:hypothetical protein
VLLLDAPALVPLAFSYQVYCSPMRALSHGQPGAKLLTNGIYAISAIHPLVAGLKFGESEKIIESGLPQVVKYCPVRTILLLLP